MRRIICFALFGLLVTSDAAFSQTLHSASPHRRVFVHGPHYRLHPGSFHRHHYFDPFRYFVQDFTTAYSAPESIVPFSPTYFFLPRESPTRPQLIFTDGTTYSVADFWRVDDQLHFITSEEGGTKSVPRTVPFGDLDLQRTTDANTAQGFKFRMRDEPIEQWLQHHPPEKTSKTKAGKKATIFPQSLNPHLLEFIRRGSQNTIRGKQDAFSRISPHDSTSRAIGNIQRWTNIC